METRMVIPPTEAKEESKTTVKSVLNRDVLAAMFLQSILSNPKLTTEAFPKDVLPVPLAIDASFEWADRFIKAASE